jgi:hypothetical protein
MDPRSARSGGEPEVIEDTATSSAFAVHEGHTYVGTESTSEEGDLVFSILDISPDLRRAVLIDRETPRGMTWASGMLVWSTNAEDPCIRALTP